MGAIRFITDAGALVAACACASVVLAALAAVSASVLAAPRTPRACASTGTSLPPCSWEMPSFYFDDDGELHCVCADDLDERDDWWDLDLC